MDRLYDELVNYSKEDYYPMHMPGHKRNTDLLPMDNPYKIDITEIEGFDNLHQAEGILKTLSSRISKLFKAEKSYPLINGSTVGILTAISASTRKGDKILVARNSHQSVYHAIALRELKPYYIYPVPVKEISISGGISALQVEDMLIKNGDITLVVITSPTYEGVVSDIGAISHVVHRHGALLLVDEAHGAHFGFHEGFPKSAVTLGADLVIQSLHKTLPAFTQTAVLHTNRLELDHKIVQFLAIYQSSSPSYLLLCGMDRCISMLEDNAKPLFNSFFEKLEEFYQSMEALKSIKLLNRKIIGRYSIYNLDPSKLTISVRDSALNGHQMNELLQNKYHIVMEMETIDYVLGMTSICDTKEGFGRLAEALLTIDHEEAAFSGKHPSEGNTDLWKPVQAILPSEAMERKSEFVKLKDSRGKVSAALVCLYPPGSPLLVPGEIIEDEFLEVIEKAKLTGLKVTGLHGEISERHGDVQDEIEVVCTSFTR